MKLVDALQTTLRQLFLYPPLTYPHLTPPLFYFTSLYCTFISPLLSLLYSHSSPLFHSTALYSSLLYFTLLHSTLLYYLSSPLTVEATAAFCQLRDCSYLWATTLLFDVEKEERKKQKKKEKEKEN